MIDEGLAGYILHQMINPSPSQSPLAHWAGVALSTRLLRLRSASSKSQGDGWFAGPLLYLGTDGPTKTDEFSEKFQIANFFQNS